jgi:3-oxoacyl-[acyl-carrier-protein] synthase-3
MESYGSSRIAGIGAYLPKQRVTTDELMREVNSRRFGIPDDYISRYVGIEEKRVAESTDQPSDLATLASKIALKDADVKADEIDLIIYTGITRDYEEPSTAHFVQDKIGAENAICMDVSNACLGFMTGFSVAEAFIGQGTADTVLICTGENPNTYLNETISVLLKINDKNGFKNRLGFLTAGDAGAAVIVTSGDRETTGWKGLRFKSDGAMSKLCYYKKQVTGIDGEMLMKKISCQIVKMHADMMDNTYKVLGWEPGSIKKLYCHQVGKKPHQSIVDVAKVHQSVVPATFSKYGNLTSATIPVAMHLNKPSRGDRLLFCGTGSGLSICQGGMVF